MTSLFDFLKLKPFLVDLPPPPSQSTQLLPRYTVVASKGKWVSVQGRVGILSQFVNHDTVIVDFVDPITGATTERAQTSIGMCANATAAQIPECRKVGLTSQDLAGLGYF
jgi:hypothetical protein